MLPSRQVYPIEKIISAGTYLTVGGVGFVWLIIATLMKKRVTSFLMYHIMQSIFISIAYFLLVKFAELVFIILCKIPFIKSIAYFGFEILNMPIPILFGLSVLQTFTSSIILYLTITAFMGKRSYLPWISDIIRTNIGE